MSKQSYMTGQLVFVKLAEPSIDWGAVSRNAPPRLSRPATPPATQPATPPAPPESPNPAPYPANARYYAAKGQPAGPGQAPAQVPAEQAPSWINHPLFKNSPALMEREAMMERARAQFQPKPTPNMGEVVKSIAPMFSKGKGVMNPPVTKGTDL